MQIYTTERIADVLGITERINQANSIDEVQSIVLDEVLGFGITHVFAGIIPLYAISVQEQLSQVIFGNWPQEWAIRYFHKGYLEQDPTIAHLRTSNNSLAWKELQSQQSIVMNEASEFRLHDGITVPMISTDGVKLGMSFAGSHISQSPQCQLLCNFIAAIATARVLEILRKQVVQTKMCLSPAEYSCLQWAVEGKTNSEIGQILSISEKTVEKHMSKCYLKTNTLNRTQLVAISFRNGLIH